jgi:hypothetical protein
MPTRKCPFRPALSPSRYRSVPTRAQRKPRSLNVRYAKRLPRYAYQFGCTTLDGHSSPRRHSPSCWRLDGGIRWYSSSTTWFQGCSCHVLRRLGGPSSSVQHSRPQWAIMSWHCYWPHRAGAESVCRVAGLRWFLQLVGDIRALHGSNVHHPCKVCGKSASTADPRHRR